MKIRIFILIMFTVSSLCGQGQSTGHSSLDIPLSARLAALGEGIVADRTSFTSFVLNPALLSYSEEPEFSLSHQQWIEDIQSEFFAAVFPFSFGSIAFSTSVTSVPGIELRDIPGPPRGTFTARSGNVDISISSMIFTDLTAGVTIRYLYQKIYVDEAEGISLNAGVAFPSGVDGLAVGLSILSLGKLNDLRSESTTLPTKLLAGLSYQMPVNGNIDANILLSAGNETSPSRFYISGGVEAQFDGLLFARVSYQSGYEARGFAAGVGIQSIPFLVDYSFVPFSYGLGSAHLFTLGVRL